MKKKITLTVDEEIHEQAQKAGINISAFLTKELGHTLFRKNNLDETKQCGICGCWFEGRAILINDLTWLCPEEFWICGSCLKLKENQVSISGKLR